MWQLSEKKDPRKLVLLIYDITANYVPNIHSPPLRWVQNPVLFKRAGCSAKIKPTPQDSCQRSGPEIYFWPITCQWKGVRFLERLLWGQLGRQAPLMLCPPLPACRENPCLATVRVTAHLLMEENAGAGGTTETPVCRADFTFLY